MPKGWITIRRQCLVRDKRICQRCGHHHPYGYGLTVHHIRPRAEGGDDSMGNLVTVCRRCHDWIEGRGFRNRAMIQGSMGMHDMPISRISAPATESPLINQERSKYQTFWVDRAQWAMTEAARIIASWRRCWIEGQRIEDHLSLEDGGGWATRDETGI